MIEFARGPLLRFALLFMALGLLRNLVLAASGFARILLRTDDPRISWRKILEGARGRVFPSPGATHRRGYGYLSLILHVGLVVTPIFLAGHVLIVRRNLGIGWPSLPAAAADVLAAATVLSALAMIASRLSWKTLRQLTGASDIFFLALLATVFASGFMVSHPGANVLGYPAAMLLHLLAADLVFILVPVTRLAHVSLIPAAHALGDIGWKLAPDGGEAVARALGKEKQPI
ncbi:MAG: hypothetical protein AAB215_02020 [Planctomycetota bacterium]